jgi:hypothetical protein
MNRSKHPTVIHDSKTRWLQKYQTAESESEKQFLLVHAETSINRIRQHIKNPEMALGFISGFVNVTKEGEVLTPELPIEKQLENLKALIADVKAIPGLSYTVVEGAYMGQKERSLVIFCKKENAEILLDFLKKAADGKTSNLSKLKPDFWQHSFIFKEPDSDNGFLYDRNNSSWGRVSLGTFSSLDVEDIYSKLLKKGQRWKKDFKTPDGKTTKFRFACAWNGVDNKEKYFNETLIKRAILDTLIEIAAEKKQVKITLNFDNKPTKQDIYSYLKSLVDDDSLKYVDV